MPTAPQSPVLSGSRIGGRAISTYLVTGCAGFIGSHLAEALVRRGDAVVGIDSLTDYYARELKLANLEELLTLPRFTLLEADILDAPLGRLLADVDGVFHLAAQPGVRGSWRDAFARYVHDNLLATRRIFDEAAPAGVRVVYASSSSVYGDAAGYPTPETTPPRPRSPYGVTKLGCEHLAHAFAANFSLDAIGIRYFTVYGPRQRPDMATQRIIEALIEGRPFKVFGTGEQSRDVTYVDDAVRATISIMETAPPSRIFNVGGGSETSLQAIIAACEEISGESLDTDHGPVAPGDVRRTAADVGRVLEETGWAPQVPLDEGLTSQIAWAVCRGAWAVPTVSRL